MGKFIGKTIIEGGQGRTQKNYDLNKVVGRPTGQGFGAARKGPQVQGTIEAQVKEESKIENGQEEKD